MPNITPIKIGAELLVNTKTTNEQRFSRAATLSNGNYIVVWNDQRSDNFNAYTLRGQIIDSLGQKVGSEFVIGGSGTSAKWDVNVAAASTTTGGFVVTWTDQGNTPGDSSDDKVHGQVFENSGQTTGAEFLVGSTTSARQTNSDVTFLSNGRLLVTWNDVNGNTGDQNDGSILGQLYDGNGQKIGASFLVNSTTTSGQYDSRSAPLANGGFVVTWTDSSQTGGDTSSFTIRGQRFDANGAKLDPEFLVNTTTSNAQVDSRVTGLSNGGFVVTWTDSSQTGGDTSGNAIRAQVYNASGQKVGSEFLVNTTTSGTQVESSVAALAGGKFVVTWTDSGILPTVVRGQTFNIDGQKVGAEFLVDNNGFGSHSDVVSIGNGSRFLVTWTDSSGTNGDTSGGAIRSQLFTVNRPPTVTMTADGGVAQVTGGSTTALNQWLGAAEPDGDSCQITVTLSGDGGTLLKNGVAVSGNQAVVNLQDFSTLSFRGSAASGSATVQISASDGTETSDTVTLTVTTIAASPTTPTPVTPSNGTYTGTSASETLTGTPLAESFFGLAGNDTMQGGGGNDQFDGGTGTDLAVLGATGGSVIVTDVETVQGSSGVDVVTLAGVAGAYTIVTLSSVETVVGGVGIDVPILGSTGGSIVASNVEYIIGGAGVDVVTTGSVGGVLTMRGVETLIGAAALDLVFLGDTGNSLLVQSGVEYLIGGTATDVVTLGSGGSTMTVRGLETILGGVGKDNLILGNTDNILTLSGIETLTGGLGIDIPVLGDSGSTITVNSTEYLIGGAGIDVVTLGGNGGVITVRGLETMIGSRGVDYVVFGNSGNTMLAHSNLEYLIGGSGTDVVTLSSAGSTTTVRGLETVIGGSGRDILQLGNSINELSVSGIETLTGGISADTVTVTGTTAISVEGGSGPDAITLAAAVSGNHVVYRSVEDGAYVGTVVGYDTITNFDANDQIALVGQIAGFVDRNGDGVLQGGARAQGGVDLINDEVVLLSGNVADLTADLTVLRSAIGKTQEGQGGSSILALAHNTTNSAAYLVTDADGDGWIASNEVRLLGLFSGTAGIGVNQVIIG